MRDQMVHAPSPLLLDFLQVRPHSVRSGFPFDLDFPARVFRRHKVKSRKLEVYGSLQPHTPTMITHPVQEHVGPLWPEADNEFVGLANDDIPCV
jgi:hypothetical protein